MLGLQLSFKAAAYCFQVFALLVQLLQVLGPAQFLSFKQTNRTTVHAVLTPVNATALFRDQYILIWQFSEVQGSKVVSNEHFTQQVITQPFVLLIDLHYFQCGNSAGRRKQSA